MRWCAPPSRPELVGRFEEHEVRRILRTLFIAASAVTATLVLFLVFTLPRPAIRLDAVVPQNQVTGGYHVHSNRSDGTGSVDDIAAAAARAGLQFVVFTDHGDGTRAPDAPTYRHGVLCIDAFEVNSDAGHVVALGIREPAPYPLAGPARDVIEDIHRLGGVAVVAHPDSPSAALRWRGQGGGYDGIEWLNVDSEWRDERPLRLLASVVRSSLRSPEVIASLFSRPFRTFQRWDDGARQRPLFGLAAIDAHARIGLNEMEEPRRHTLLARPSYESLFRTVAQAVLLDGPLSGQPDHDASRIVAALAAGRSFSVVRAIAEPAVFRFTATQGARIATMGERGLDPSQAVSFEAEASGAPGARVALLKDGRVFDTKLGRLQWTGMAGPGVYRVEVSIAGTSMPWIVSNPIVVGADPPRVVTVGAQTTGQAERISLPIDAVQWASEKSPTSEASIDNDGAELRWRFTLGGGAPAGQYAALSTPVRGNEGVDRVEISARADRPMRLSVQIRLPNGKDGQRWRRSIYVDRNARTIVLRLQDFEPVGLSTTRRPIVVPLTALLIVADTVNTLPGSSGTLWLSGASVGVGGLSRPASGR